MVLKQLCSIVAHFTKQGEFLITFPQGLDRGGQFLLGITQGLLGLPLISDIVKDPADVIDFSLRL